MDKMTTESSVKESMSKTTDLRFVKKNGMEKPITILQQKIHVEYENTSTGEKYFDEKWIDVPFAGFIDD